MLSTAILFCVADQKHFFNWKAPSESVKKLLISSLASAPILLKRFTLMLVCRWSNLRAYESSVTEDG